MGGCFAVTGEGINSPEVANAASVDKAFVWIFVIVLVSILLPWDTRGALDAVTVATVLLVLVCAPCK